MSGDHLDDGIAFFVGEQPGSLDRRQLGVVASVAISHSRLIGTEVGDRETTDCLQQSIPGSGAGGLCHDQRLINQSRQLTSHGFRVLCPRSTHREDVLEEEPSRHHPEPHE